MDAARRRDFDLGQRKAAQPPGGDRRRRRRARRAARRSTRWRSCAAWIRPGCSARDRRRHAGDRRGHRGRRARGAGGRAAHRGEPRRGSTPSWIRRWTRSSPSTRRRTSCCSTAPPSSCSACGASEAIGTPLDRLHPGALPRRAPAAMSSSFGSTGVTSRRMGDVTTLWALRAGSGEEFPIEASISQARRGRPALLHGDPARHHGAQAGRGCAPRLAARAARAFGARARGARGGEGAHRARAARRARPASHRAQDGPFMAARARARGRAGAQARTKWGGCSTRP